jgi:hypothetical protein
MALTGMLGTVNSMLGQIQLGHVPGALLVSAVGVMVVTITQQGGLLVTMLASGTVDETVYAEMTGTVTVTAGIATNGTLSIVMTVTISQDSAVTFESFASGIGAVTLLVTGSLLVTQEAGPVFSALASGTTNEASVTTGTLATAAAG